MKIILLPLFCLTALAPQIAYSQEYQCDNQGKNATSVRATDVISCSFEQEQDSDVFVLASTSPGGIKVRVSPPSGNCIGVPDFTPLIEVYNSSNVRVAARGTSGTCNIAIEEFTTVENETYSIIISLNNQQTPIDYTV